MQHHPLPEYPRPALRRDSYENLNGLWQYAITGSAGLPAKWDGDILVPYSPETKASGVGRTLQPGAWLHYHRSFVPPAGTGGRVLLHFGAVDYACAVQVNGHLVGGHRGGYWPLRWISPRSSTVQAATACGWRCRTPPATAHSAGQADFAARGDVLSRPERHLADGLAGARAGKLHPVSHRYAGL